MSDDRLRDRVRRKRLLRNLTYEEWVGNENAEKLATREEVVAFSNFQLQEQVLPLMRNAVANAFRAYEANRWYRRLGRWLRGLMPVRRPLAREEAVRILTDIERQRMQPLPPFGQRFPDADRDG